MSKYTIVYVIRIAFIVLFTYAALSKLMDYEAFKFQLGRSPYVTGIAGLVAWVLPLGELIIALGLVFPKTVMVSLYASFFTMLLFTGYIYAMLNYSYYLPCSCGGILSEMGWTAHLWFNIGFTVLAATGILMNIANRQHFQANSLAENNYAK